MKYEVICYAYNSLPFVKIIDSENLRTVTADIDQIGSSFVPQFVREPVSGKYLRVVRDANGPSFLSSDAEELLGEFTTPDGFARIDPAVTMEIKE